MKKIRILLTGGGTGGHIYPLISVAEELFRSVKSDQEIEIRYFGPASLLNQEFEKRGITVSQIVSSKLRRYFSISNFIDIPKFIYSCFQALSKVFWSMPDIVFSKGGPGSLPVVLAARFYHIPIVIHESDTAPGLANLFSSRFAKKIIISFERVAQYFPQEKIVVAGNPVRAELLQDIPDQKTAKTGLGFNLEEPLILVLGGSQGAKIINNFVLDNLEELLNKNQIIHQAGLFNYQEAKQEADFILQHLGDFFKKRYRLEGYLEENLKEAMAAADLILSRAGAGAIFEIAALGKPSILIPLEEAAGNHQKTNAYEYSKNGAAVVIEETNFTVSIFVSQAQKIFSDPELKNKMSEAAKKFAKPEAAKKIAEEILRLV